MGLKYDFNNIPSSNKFHPLRSNMGNMPLYTNTVRQCPSQISILKTNNRKQTNYYANISETAIKFEETSCATLTDTLPLKTVSNAELIEDSQTSDENNKDNINRFYENIDLNSTSSEVYPDESLPDPRIYINFQHDVDKQTTPSVSSSGMSPFTKKTTPNTSLAQTTNRLELNKILDCDQEKTTSTRQQRTLHRPRQSRRQEQHLNLSLDSTEQMKSVSNQLYQEICPSVSLHRPLVNYVQAGIFECPILQFHGTLQQQVFLWYPTAPYIEEELISQVVSTSENGRFNQQDETDTTIEESEEEKEEEEDDAEELFPHETFEDFFLRRPPQSTRSSSSDTSTSSERPVRPPPLNRSVPSLALGLDRNDVDFIHKIIRPTQRTHRTSNRVTALREAYERAREKRIEFLKAKKLLQTNAKKTMTVNHSFTASKIRDELEKYDELPAQQKPNFRDDDVDTYSGNDDYQYYHRRPLPVILSTTQRIINFITSLKRQVQKNFHDIRSRLLLDAMTVPSNHAPRHRYTVHNLSNLTRRPVTRPTSAHPMLHRHRRQFYRTHSNTSQLHSHRQRTARSASCQQ